MYTNYYEFLEETRTYVFWPVATICTLHIIIEAPLPWALLKPWVVKVMVIV